MTASRVSIIFVVLILSSFCASRLEAGASEGDASCPQRVANCAAANKDHVRITIFPRDIYYDSTVRIGLDALQAIESQNVSESLNVVDWSYGMQYTVGRSDLFSLTLCGSKGGPSGQAEGVNQDRSFALQDSLHGLKAGGVLDGHGSLGHHVAEFGRNEIIRRTLHLARTQQNTTANPALVAAWIENILLPGVDADLPDAVAYSGGATVSIILQLHKHVFMINAGDSQSFLLASCRCGCGDDDSTARGAANSSRMLYETRLDKPDLPEEKARIVSMGGRVTETSKDDDARVWYTYSDPISGKSSNYGLAMSRGIGDRPSPGVIPTPLVQVRHVDDLVAEAKLACVERYEGGERKTEVTDLGEVLSENKIPLCVDSKVRILAVSATDGLIDYLSGVDMAQALFNHETHVFLNARDLFYKAASRWNRDMGGSYRDDMALSVFAIET